MAGDAHPGFQTKPTDPWAPGAAGTPAGGRPLPGAAPPALTVLGEVGPARRPAAGAEQQQGQGRGGPHGAGGGLPAGRGRPGPRGLARGGWTATPTRGRPGAAANPGPRRDREGAALLQSRGLNRTLGANHSGGGGGGWRGAGLGAGGYGLQHSPLPPPPTPPPRRRGASRPLPGELRQPGSGVEPGEGAGPATDPRAPLFGLGWREGVGMALGQLAGAATAGLDQGVPTSPRPSHPSLFSLATEIPKSPGCPPSTVRPGTSSHWVTS